MENHSVITRSPFSEAFLHRSLRMTALLTLLGALFCLTYFGPWQALAFLSGGVWGIVNMLFIKAIVKMTITPGQTDRFAVWGLMLIKFPALYLAGYGLLSFEKFGSLYLLCGFSLFFAVVVLKAIGRAALKMDGANTSVQRDSILN